MKNLLFLAHRIPYPPNKGDKIRSYHFLKGLSEHYNIYLAAFIDDPDDWRYVDKVKDLTASSLFVKINPLLAKIKSLSGLVTNRALTEPYYQHNLVKQWVEQVVSEHKIEKIFIFSSAMAQYVTQYQDLDIVIDFVDVDSDKWLQYSEKAQWPMNWVYKRESRQLLSFDTKVAKLAKMSLFVSEEESKLFQKLVDLNPERISYVNNGVDIDYFNQDENYESPYTKDENRIVFTGAMDYWANVDAVKWFVHAVFPKIKQQCTDVTFYIVGSNPSKEVMQLANTEGVFVTGRVEDIRPYLFYCNVVVAPLQIARGIQNKVLEAMAMGKVVIATTQAIEGINITDQTVRIANEAEDFSRHVLSFLTENHSLQNDPGNRLFVQTNFSWDSSLKRLIQVIQ